MRRPTRITVLGYDGTRPAPELEDLWDAVYPEAQAHFGDEYDLRAIHSKTPWGEQPHPQNAWCIDRVKERLFSWVIAETHNALVDDVNRMISLGERTRRARDEVDSLYGDLDKNTTINWLATHHRFVKAAIRARDLLTAYADLVTDLASRYPDILGDPRKSLSALYYTAHIPEDERLPMPTQDDAATARATLDEFVAQTTNRFEILRATITGGFPPGFAPAPIEVTAEWAGDNIPISPALAYADAAMRIPGPRPGDPHASVRSWS